MRNRMIAAASLFAAIGVPGPANAVVTTIASFRAPTSASNFRFVNFGGSSDRGFDAAFYSTTTATANTAGSVITQFSFVNTALAGFVTAVNARFTLNGTVARNTPASPVFGSLTQGRLSGTFSFLSTAPITVTGPDFVVHTYAAGSTLLSGRFTDADLLGSGLRASVFDASGNTGAVTFESDFLDLSQTSEQDFGFSLSSIAPALEQATGANRALKSFRGVLGGQASTDPVGLPYGLATVPEPATWAMLLLGFGAMGAAMRHHRRDAKRALA